MHRKRVGILLLGLVSLSVGALAASPDDLYAWTFEGAATNGPALRHRWPGGQPQLDYNQDTAITEYGDAAFGNACVRLNEASGSYLDLPSSFLSHTMTQLSISVWVNLDEIEINDCFVSRYPTGGSNGDLLFKIFQPAEFRPQFLVRENGTLDGQRVDVGADTTNVWRHVAVVFDGTQADADDRIRFWIDNSEVSDSGAFGPTNIVALAQPWRVGAYLDTDRRLKGRIDDLLITDRALTPADISVLYTGGIEVFIPPTGTAVIVR
jgi:hypothetical protein